MDARVGPYRIVRLINGGGQGQVYLGFDPRLRRRLAIKVRRLPTARRARRAALQEARQLAQLQDERVVRIHDVVVSSDYLALVMEYIPGCDLEALLSAGPLSLGSILVIATDISAALAAARQRSIVHGDLKAANVLITTQGRAKLADFGIASADSVQGPGVGSASSLAPEQLSGASLDVRTDLFALGRLLFRMLTGEHSYSIAGAPSTKALAQQDPPRVAERVRGELDVPVELVGLVQQLLCKDPAERPANTHQVRRTFRSVARALPLAARGSLALEAGPLFRSEEPGDLPPSIPGQLARFGRSRRERAEWRARWLGWFPRSRNGRLALVMAAGLALMTTVVLLRPSPLSVHVQEPVLEIAAGSGLASEIDASFLVRHAGAALRSRHDPVYLSGAVPPRTVFTHAARARLETVSEQLAIKVRCSSAFCLLNLQRIGAAASTSHQQILLSDASAEAWSRSLQRAVMGLYP